MHLNPLERELRRTVLDLCLLLAQMLEFIPQDNPKKAQYEEAILVTQMRMMELK